MRLDPTLEARIKPGLTFELRTKMEKNLYRTLRNFFSRTKLPVWTKQQIVSKIDSIYIEFLENEKEKEDDRVRVKRAQD